MCASVCVWASGGQRLYEGQKKCVIVCFITGLVGVDSRKVGSGSLCMATDSCEDMRGHTGSGTELYFCHSLLQMFPYSTHTQIEQIRQPLA